jgi:hypothetical protein
MVTASCRRGAVYVCPLHGARGIEVGVAQDFKGRSRVIYESGNSSAATVPFFGARPMDNIDRAFVEN